MGSLGLDSLSRWDGTLGRHYRCVYGIIKILIAPQLTSDTFEGYSNDKGQVILSGVVAVEEQLVKQRSQEYDTAAFATRSRPDC